MQTGRLLAFMQRPEALHSIITYPWQVNISDSCRDSAQTTDKGFIKKTFISALIPLIIISKV
ncbi:hypothetical protein L3081_06460 [Colwellia sp. MSW7]|uniref:Uncharacterized protein n=1 Tax=Colwellia maritima TaxID=2912588 RepID=A0ABS9WYV1_9GAMM|nr:hypothetical protein [Colwellia maritima]